MTVTPIRKDAWESIGIDPGDLRHTQNKVQCPQCQDERKEHPDDKPLSVNVEDGVYMCHHCGWRGSVNSDKPWRPKPAVKYKSPDPKNISGTLPNEVVEWFAARGISKETLQKYKVAWGQSFAVDKDGNTVTSREAVDHWASGILFPFYRDGQLANIKRRSIGGLSDNVPDKRFMLAKDAQVLPYGFDDIDDNETIIVEGEIDKLTLAELGYPNAISVPNGAQNTNWIDECWERLEKVRKWIIAVDNDEAGKLLETELTRRLGRERCWKVVWPENDTGGYFKDVNEILQDYPIEQHKLHPIVRMFDEARPYPLEGLVEALDIEPDLNDLFNYGLDEGISVISALDSNYKIATGSWTVVTGIPGHGKSEFVDQMVTSLVENEKWKFFFWSPENAPLKRHMSKLMEKHTGYSFLPNAPQRMTEEQFLDAKDWLDENFIFATGEQLTLDQILALIRQAIIRKGIKGAVIDPWSEVVQGDDEKHFDERRWINSSLSKIRSFARQWDIHIWVVAHPTKLARGKDGKRPVPTMYDIAGAAAWYNKADYGLVVYRNMEQTSVQGAEQLVEIHIAKCRWKNHGMPGTVTMRWNRSNGRFESTNIAPTYNAYAAEDHITGGVEREVVDGSAEFPF